MAKVLISMREDFLDKIDEIAQKEHRSRSELIREALRSYAMKRKGSAKAVNSLLDAIILD